MWPFEKKKKPLSFDEFQAQKASGAAPTPAPSQNGVLSFEQFKANKTTAPRTQAPGFEEFRQKSPAIGFDEFVKPAKTPIAQPKPVDQIEHEMSFGEKLKSTGLGFLKSGEEGLSMIGGALESKGKALQQPYQKEEPGMVRKGVDTVLDAVVPGYGASRKVRYMLEPTQAVQNTESFIGRGLEKAGTGIKKVYGETAKKIGEDPEYDAQMASFRGEDGRLDPAKFADPWTYISTIAQGIGSFIPGAAVGLATKNPYAAGATMGLMEKGDAVQSYADAMAKDKGVSIDQLSPEDLKKIDVQSDYYGAASAVLESAFPGLLSKIIKEGGGSIIKNTLRAIPAEGGTEGIQRFTQNLIAKTSGINPDQDLSEGVLDEAIAGALTGVAVAGPTAALAPKQTINENIVPGEAPTEETPTPQEQAFSPEPVKSASIEIPGAYNPKKNVQDFFSVLNSGEPEKVQQTTAKMSKKELEETERILESIREGSEGEALSADKMMRVADYSEQIAQLIEDKQANIDTEAKRIASGEAKTDQTPQLHISDQAQVKNIIEKVASVVAPEKQEAIKKQLESEIDTTTLPGVKETQVLLNENNPFVEAKSVEDIATRYEEEKSKTSKTLIELDAEKASLLAQKTATEDKFEKKNIQNAIDDLDVQRRQIQANESILAEQAGAKQLSMMQETIDKIREVEPDFSVVDSVEKGWGKEDYDTYLTGIKPVETSVKVDAQRSIKLNSTNTAPAKKTVTEIEPVSESVTQVEKEAEIKEETPVATVTEKIEKEESVKVLEGIENDIPLKTAISAHSGTSFDPEKRGKSRVDDYVDTIKSDYEELQALATTPEKQAILDEMFPSYRNGYKDRMIETLNAESRTVSTMITGPANFNVERNRKRNETADKRRDEAIEFRKKLITKIKNAINPSQASSFLGTSQKTIEAMGEKLADLKATQARMKEANRIIRAGKNVAEELGKLGYAPDIVKTLQLPDYAGRIGFASFELTSINNKIKSLEKREKLTARKREIADTIGNTEFTMGDVRVVKNFDENRIQIIFPGKPDAGMISKLKGKGFRWSPKNTAWQRVLTNRAIYDAKALLESEPVVAEKENIEPDYVPFKLKSDAAILKEDTADARIAMQEAVSATLFNEKLWDRIQDRTSEGMTDFDDFGFLTTLREQLETGKKVDPEVIRQAIEIIGKYGIPLSDAVMDAIPEKIKKESRRISTTILEKLGDRKTVSKQFISDLTNGAEVRQVEREMIREALTDFGDQVDVEAFKDAIDLLILPLDVTDSLGGEPLYEYVTLPDSLRGSIADYFERVYESPVKTSAGSIHFGRDQAPERYFAHTRIEDLKTPHTKLPSGEIKYSTDSVRRIIEVQSDLFQKGRLENEKISPSEELIKMERDHADGKVSTEEFRAAEEKFYGDRSKELSKLEPYRNTFWERIIREEIKQAAEDGRSTLLFPTGETAMKIEGLSNTNNWRLDIGSNNVSENPRLRVDHLYVGETIFTGFNDQWIITDVLGDGKFKAVPKSQWEKYNYQVDFKTAYDRLYGLRPDTIETFDISGKVDINNPIYRFYEKDIQKFLRKIRPDMQVITDERGVTWYKTQVTEKDATDPVMAFSMRKSEEKPLENQTEAFVRGADQVKVELLARVHDGKLKTRDYQEMSYFLDLVSPHIAEMAANIGGKPYDENADGMYDWISNTISIFDNVQNTQNLKQTFYHEIGHHLSRYIPSEMFAQLYEKFTVEQMAYYEAHPEAKMAENLSQEAKMAHFAKYNVDYQFFNFDEYFAEMIRTKTEAEILEKFGVENESATMRVVRYAKELIKAMYEAIRKYRTTDAADKAFSLLTSGVKLEVSNQFGLEARLNRNQDYQAELKRRRARLYRAYERNIDKLEPTKAISFERAFNREISEEALHEASDILIREGIKTADFYAFKVKKLPEQKYNGAFLAPQFADEYRSIIDSMAEMVDSERNMMEEQEIAQTFADYIDPELESQLSSFESTLKKVRNEKGKEILQSGDFEGVKKFLITRGYSASDVDNMFYSSEQSQDDILDRFREIIMQRDPGLLTGRKAEKGLSLRKQIMSAKENIEAGKSMFSEQYKDYQAEAESLLKKSYALFSKDDQRFIDASLMLKNALKSVRNEKEKRVAMQTGSKLGKSVVRAKYRGIINEFQDRKRKVRYAKEFFGLSDAQFKKIGGNVAVQYLTEDQFSNFLNRFETAAAEEQEKNFLIEIIQKSIKERQLKKEKNLLRAWKYPTNLKNLTADQLRQFDAALSQLEDGDTVLTQRQIETVGNTELKGIQSLSEARKRLAKRMNVSPESLMNLSAGEFDAFRYDTALAERNPFYEVLVDDTNREMLQADQRFIELKDKTNRLISASRKSRPRSILGRLIPTDENIFKYLESENKAEIAKDMTPAEIEAAEFIRGTYSVVRDYLIERQMLNRSRENYITHIRKGFLEKWKDDGFVKAIKSVFEQYQEDEANFNILDESTGEILPMEKFFKFSLQRTGELDPTQNVGDAFITYMRTFEKKRAFDAIIPKMEIYSDALANEKESKSGLQLDRSLKKLVREWINNKKGRRITVLKVKQGGKMDLAIRFGNTLVSVIDLGLSLPVGIATQIGEQGTNFVMLGTKAFAKSHTRTFTKQGKEILQKYQSFTQENPWSHLVEASDNVGDMMAKSLFILFRDSQWRANRQFLLGSLTDEEFASGTISPERLARMKRNMGRFRVVEGAESIVGSTSTGKFISKYKTWAVPIFRTTIKDLTEIYKNPKKIQSQEGQEIFRIAIVTALAALAAYALIGDDDDKPNSQKSFLEKLLAKSIRESLSLVGALDPRFWLAEPRLMAFLSDFTGSLIQIVKISEYDDSYVIGDRYTTSKDGSYEAGDLKGVNALQRTITPQFMKQFYPPEE